MNSRLYRLSLLVIGLQTVSSLAFSMPSMKVEQLPDGKFRIVGCGFDKGASFSVQYGKNGIPMNRKTTAQGCVDETLTAMTDSTTEMIVVYKNEKASVPVTRASKPSTQPQSQPQPQPNKPSSGGYTRPDLPPQPNKPSSGGYTRPDTPGVPTKPSTGSSSSSTGSTGSTSSTAPAQRPTQPTQPTTAPVQLKAVSPAEVRDKAQQAAKQFMERVLRVYGSIERARQGVRSGLDEANRTFESFRGDITRIPEFASAMRQGEDQGRREGYEYGERLAKDQATHLGALEADSRFARAAMENAQASPDLKYDVKVPDSVQGLKPEVTTQNLDLRSSVGTLTPNLQSEIRLVLQDELPGGLSEEMLRNNFTMTSIWGRTYESGLRDAFDNPSQAFDMWISANIQGLVPDLAIQQWLTMVNDGSKYAQAQPGLSNRELFRREFMNTYSVSFNNRWEAFVRESDGRIASGSREVGKRLFQKVLTAKAQEVGTQIGYNREFNIGARATFRNNFETFAQQGFNDVVERYQRSAVLSNVEMQLTTRSQRDLAPGDLVNLKIVRALNKGLKPLEEVIHVSSRGLIISGEAPVFKLPGVSSIKETDKAVIENFAQVASNAPFGEAFDARIQVGTAQLDVRLMVTVKGAVQKIAEVGRAAAPEAAQAIVTALRAEWDKDAGSVGTIYDNGDTKIDEVVNAVAALSADKQAKFTAEMLSEIQKAYPPQQEPGWFGRTFQKDSDDYEELAKVFARVKWTLK